MANRIGELQAQDLSDIENPKFVKKCFACKQNSQVRLTLMIGDRVTKNETIVCTNPNCFRYCNTKNLESWLEL